MNTLRIVLLLNVLLIAWGCGPKCGPSTKVEARISQTAPLPFRVSGITITVDPGSQLDQESNLYNTDHHSVLQGFVKRALLDSSLYNNNANRVVSVRILAQKMYTGDQSFLLGKVPSTYSAKYQVYNPETKAVLWEKTYEVEKSFQLVSDLSCPQKPEAKAALYEAFNEVNSQFIDSLYQIESNELTKEGERIRGTLGIISVSVPMTGDNYTWINNTVKGGQSGRIYVLRYLAELIRDFAADITQSIQNEKLFDYSPGNKYDVLVVVPNIKAKEGGLFSKSSAAFEADAIIFKNGDELTNVEMSVEDCPKEAPLEDLLEIYKRMIVDKLRTLR